MKKILFLLLLSSKLFATTFYIDDTGGNDANAGTSPAEAWQTLSKLNTIFSHLANGSNVLFKRGGTWDGSITVSRSGAAGNPITVGAYGTTGANPIITGFTTITSGWTNEGGGIYSKVITSAAQTNMVTIDGVQYGMGRYPDLATGYLTFTGYATNTKIWKTGFRGSPNWKGAEVAIRKTDYQIDRCTITNHTVDTLTYTSLGSSATPKAVGFGFFIQNDLRTLTTYGEWYHDYAGTGKFYVYFGGGGPSGHTVNVATVNNLVNASVSQDYITFNNLDFEGSIDDAFAMTGSNNDYWLVQNNTINFAGKHGIELLGGTGNVFDNNIINTCNNDGIKTFVGCTISNNIFRNTSLIPGQGLTAYNFNMIFASGNGVTITNNDFKNAGGNGIYCGYNGTTTSTVQYNRIDSVMLISDDGAGIYTSSNSTGARIFDHNIISNVLGNSDGTNTSTSITCGIYLDEPAQNVTVTNNTVFDIVGPSTSGIKMHKANTNTVKYNTVYNVGNAMQILNSQASNSVFSNTIIGNIFFAKTSTQNVLNYSSLYNDLTTFGTSDSNYWARPIDDNVTFYTNQPSTGLVNRTLATWRSFTSQDVHSHKAPKTIASTNELIIVYNATSSPVEYNFQGNKKILVNGSTVDSIVTVPAWSSVILLDDRTPAVERRAYYHL